MQELLTVIVFWLSVNFALPTSDELPRVALVSGERMVEVRRERSSASTASTHVAISESRDTDAVDFHALYDDLERTIYLPEDWTAASPAQVSLLVHELVHHLQNVGAVRHACAAERERTAYRAQARWLELVGTSLEETFGIDPMTLLVRTSCMH